MATTDKRNAVKSTQKSFEILERIEAAGETSLKELATTLDAPKSTLHNHLTTLTDKGYLIKEGDTYRMGLKFLRFGHGARQDLPVYAASKQLIQELADQTGEAVWIGARENGRAVYVNKAMGDRGVPSQGEIGQRVPMLTCSMGKAVLAYLPQERREDILQNPRDYDHTPPAKSPAALREELAEIREREVAFNDGESAHGLRGVASPIIDDGVIAGAVALAGPRSRLEDAYFREELPNLIRGIADEIELRMAYAD